jgi:hypothetical protein
MDFGTALIVVAVVAAVVAAGSYWGSGRIYSGLGREGGLEMTREPRLPTSGPEVQEEIRQMLEAKSARSEARGQGPIDIDAEIAALTAAPSQSVQDPALREEVRQLVVARNQRRIRRGDEPLDVEAEIDRELRRLT